MKRKKERPGLVGELLSAKADLADDLADDDGTIKFAVQVVPYGGMPRQNRLGAAALCAKFGLSLDVSENIAVTRDLCHLINEAGAELPEDYIAEHHHLYSEHGFVYLEQPIQDEVHELPIRALSWHHGRGLSTRRGKPETLAGIEINLWSEVTNKTSHGNGRFLPAGADFLPYGLPSIGWAETEDALPGESRLPDVKLSKATRFVLTLQAFLADELPAVARYSAPKSMAGTMRRLKWPEPGVTVIDLRKRHYRPRLDADGNDEAAWHLQYRHVVRGHWAKRWVGPNHPRHSGTTDAKETIHVYIAPFVKGPEDAPFLMNEKVAVVRR